MTPKFATAELRAIYEEPTESRDLGAQVLERYRYCVYCLTLAPTPEAALPMQSLGMSKLDDGSGRFGLQLTEDWELVTNFKNGGDEYIAVIEALRRSDKETRQ